MPGSEASICRGGSDLSRSLFVADVALAIVD
jgi:hypothetical protein